MKAATLKFIRSLQTEVEASRTLRFFGFALGLTNVFTYFLAVGFGFPFEPMSGDLPFYLVPGGLPLCWPRAWFCGWPAHLPVLLVSIVMVVYLIVSFVITLSFLRPKGVATGLWGLAILSLGKFLFLHSSTVTVANYHYVILVPLIVYFFFPKKVATIQIALVLIYASAGFLKLNPEWLSGAALLQPNPAFVPSTVTLVLLRLAVVFELFVVFGLLARSKPVRAFAFAVLVGFHLLSWPQVSFFYPCVMLCLASIFPLSWWEEPRQASPLARLFRPSVAWSSVALLALLIAAQIYPRTLSPDVAITSEGRFMSINMLDARPICFSQMIVHRTGHGLIEQSENAFTKAIRGRCDPLRFYNWAVRTCRQLSVEPWFLDLDIHVIAKRTTDPTFHRTVRLEKFCSHPTSFNFLTRNSWVGWDEE